MSDSSDYHDCRCFSFLQRISGFIVSSEAKQMKEEERNEELGEAVLGDDLKKTNENNEFDLKIADDTVSNDSRTFTLVEITRLYNVTTF
uniref:Uncharacterized protein n=1 Tax=Schistosoma mansoni TaxID=6183 RepID=A0A5K4FBD5_SCHMA